MRQPIPFGKYYLLERINVGGMAEVFKAKATGVEGFERMVAVKRILPSIAEDEEFITMFIDEAKIAVQLTHANVAQIFDLGKVDDSYFIALEYVHGKDLRAIFNRARSRGEQLPIPMACYAIMKLCEGLDYAHNKRDAGGQFLNLVHRDVSPQNILVSYEGEVKIIDFGIAKAAGKAGRTQAGILKGKFGYMSPEQVQGFEIDRRSDVFGVGICLYELLTGERLFVGESDFATLEKVRNVDIMPPSTYNRRIPEELEQIVLKALARDRDLRHQTSMQLHDELQGFMYGSGNFFGRRDLSMYMHRVFSEEIERETSRDQEYAAMSVPERDEVTGLTAFDDMDPVSTVSALNVQPPTQQQPRPARQGGQMAAPSPFGGSAPPGAQYPSANPGAAAQRPHKQTLLGLPAVSASPRTLPPGRSSVPPGARPASSPAAGPRPSVPPLVPRPQSVPPNHVPVAGARGGAESPPRLEMDWDDEELSTQIYDRPEEGMPGYPGAGNPGYPGHPGAAMPAPTAPASGSFPPVAAHAQGSFPPGAVMPAPSHQPPPGAPSPFGYAAVPASTGHNTAEAIWPVTPERQRSPMLMAIGAVVAIIGVIVAGLLFFRKPEPGTLHVSVTPPDASLSIDGVARSGPSPFIVSDVPPNVPHEVVISKPGYTPWSSKIQLQPGETMNLSSVALALVEAGFALDSTPSGAQIFLDGQPLDRRTPARLTDVPPGDHKVRLEAEGYAPWESPVQVTANLVLELPKAQLVALAPEGGSQRFARADSSRAVSAARAAPSLSATPRRAPPPRPVAAPRPEPTEPVAAAEPEPEPEPEPAASGGSGTLRVQTRPWSKVFIDGRMVGNTPLMGVEISAGRHTLTFVNDDFNIRKVVKVDVQPGQIVTQVLTLDE